MDLFTLRGKHGIEYNPETGVLTRRGKPVRSIRGLGYLGLKIERKHYYAHRIAWLFVHGEWPENDIDHINGIKTDNRIANLRHCTRSENQRNHGLTAANKSGRKGASYSSRCRAWVATIRVNGKQVYLGTFPDRDAAGRAYDEASKRLHGEFCYLKGVAA